MLRWTWRLLRTTDRRVLSRFVGSLGVGSLRALRRFEQRRRRGERFPAFLFLSLTNSCNLRCQGCWVTPTRPPRELDLGTLDRLLSDAVAQGTTLIGLLGGEPLLHHGMLELIGRHPECYFILFSNGTLLTDEVTGQLRAAGNVTPLISIEGRELTSDERRRGERVWQRSLAGVDACVRAGLVTGVATSVCRSNLHELANERFVDELVDQGVHYLWYYLYRPVGPDPSPELALSADQVLTLRRFLVRERTRAPMLIVDAYWDEAGRGLCPAASGVGHHISPSGDLEPCPPLQFADQRLGADGRSASELFNSSELLRRFSQLVASTTRGCILMERPDLLRELLVNSGAYDSSGRDSVLDELAAMTPRCSHDLPGDEVPETAWPYRLAKRHWFFGLGAYG